MLAFVLLGLTSQDPAPATQTFKDDILNLQFTHPVEWKIEKRDRRMVRMRIPIPATAEFATLELVKTEYRDQPEKWQTLVAQTAEQTKARMVRQWTQDLLGAPMLNSLTEATVKGKAISRFTSLYYVRAPRKLLAKIEAPSAQFDSVYNAWQRVTETFRTIDGSSLASEDPNAPPVPDRAPVESKKVLFGAKPLPTPPKTIDGPTVEVASRKFQLQIPEKWTFEDGKLRDEQGVAVEFKVYSMLDSDPSATLGAMTGADLARFKKVDLREDTVPRTSNAKSATLIIRTGEGNEGPLTSAFGALATEEAFVILVGEAKTPEEAKKLRKRLEFAIEAIGIKSVS